MGIATFKIGKVLIESGGCTLVGLVGGLISGTVNITHNVEDTNAIGSSWRAGTVLGGEWEASLECHYDPTDEALSALMVDVIAGGDSCILASVSLFTLSTTYAFSGSMIITNSTVTKAVGATDKLSVTLRGNGEVAYS